MTEYHNYGITLSDGQAKKIVRSYKKGEGCTIRISKANLIGKHNLPLTQSQINKIKNAKKGVQLKLSETQLKHMEKVGGFIPLVALIPAIMTALGAAGGIAGGVASAVSSVKATNEQARHNREVEKLIQGSGIISDKASGIPLIGKPLSAILKKIGLGGCVNNIRGLKIGNGLYLEPSTGNGLFLDPYPRN